MAKKYVDDYDELRLFAVEKYINKDFENFTYAKEYRRLSKEEVSDLSIDDIVSLMENDGGFLEFLDFGIVQDYLEYEGSNPEDYNEVEYEYIGDLEENIFIDGDGKLRFENNFKSEKDNFEDYNCVNYFSEFPDYKVIRDIKDFLDHMNGSRTYQLWEDRITDENKDKYKQIASNVEKYVEEYNLFKDNEKEL